MNHPILNGDSSTECPCDAQKTTVILNHEGRIRRVRMCNKCALEGTQSPRRGQGTSGRLAALFGERYADASLDSFRVDPEHFVAYNKVLKDAHSDQVYKNDRYRKEHVEELQAAKESLASFIDQAAARRDGRLVILGQQGCGKTHLMAAAARAFLDRGLTVDGVDALEFIGRITDTYSQRYASEERTKGAIIDKLSRSDVVFIDHITINALRPVSQRNFTWLINALTSQRRIVMMASSVRLKRLKSHENGLGPDVMDRMRMAPSRLLGLNVPSYRVLQGRMQFAPETG